MGKKKMAKKAKKPTKAAIAVAAVDPAALVAKMNVEQLRKLKNLALAELAKKACPFLELPAEMRNRIYRYALCEEQHIWIDRQHYQQPPLLRTSKQIRREASSIYYRENSFIFHMPRFDLSAPLNIFRQSGAIPSSQDRCDFGNLRRPSWPKLLRWIRAYHDETFPINLDDGAEELVPKTIGRAFNIVIELHSAKTPWKSIEKVMENFKQSTDKFMKWSDDE